MSRIHITLLDSDPTMHERSIAYMECNQDVPEGTDLHEYAKSLRVLVRVEHAGDASLDEEVLLASMASFLKATEPLP